MLPLPVPGVMTLRGVMDSSTIVYKRTRKFHDNNISQGFYNANPCDLRKLLKFR